MVDALDLQQVERGPHVGRRAFFPGVRHQVQPQLAAAREDARELLGRMAHLAGIEPDADELVAIGQRLLQRLERFLLAQVAQEAQDQRRAHAQLVLGLLAGAVQAVDHGLHAHAARGVRLRVEEDLGVHHVVGCRTAQVGPGHVVEVLLLQQHAGAGVVDVQEALQVGEGVGAAQLLHARVGNLHAVALGQREDQLGLERALDVDVQLGLGHAAQQLGQALGGNAVGKVRHGTPVNWRELTSFSALLTLRRTATRRWRRSCRCSGTPGADPSPARRTSSPAPRRIGRPRWSAAIAPGPRRPGR